MRPKPQPPTLGPLTAAALIADSHTYLFAEQVALRNNIAPETLEYWLLQGLKPNAEEPYATFARDFAVSDTELERICLRTVARAARGGKRTKIIEAETVKRPDGSELKTTIETTRDMGDVKAATWLLERRWPSRWGPISNGQRPHDPTASLQILRLLKQAGSRGEDLSEVMSNPKAVPELEQAIRDNREAILALLAEDDQGDR